MLVLWKMQLAFKKQQQQSEKCKVSDEQAI